MRDTSPVTRTRWPGYRHVVFDCDSTLSGIEGIDELAGTEGVRAEIEALTERAMKGEVELEDVYARRLELLQPDRQQVAELRTKYKQRAVPDARRVIDALQELGHEVYVVSGGLAEPVREYAVSLGVPEEHVVAVHTRHDTLSGEWWRTDARDPHRFLDYEEGALSTSDGKATAIAELTRSGDGGVVLVGDGVSDLNARTAVDTFVGFGGFVTRERVEREADVFVSSTTLAPVLALAAGPSGRAVGSADHVALIDDGVQAFRSGTMRFKDPSVGARFERAFSTQDRP